MDCHPDSQPGPNRLQQPNQRGNVMTFTERHPYAGLDGSFDSCRLIAFSHLHASSPSRGRFIRLQPNVSNQEMSNI
jgi:hypothetical protein